MSEIQIKRTVALWDSDMDQFLEPHEAINAIKSMGIGMDATEEETLGKDLEKKGKISWDDCIALIKEWQGKKGANWLADNLKKFDHNSNGTIATNELDAG